MNIKGPFERIAPDEEKKILPQGQVAVSHHLMPDKKQRRLAHGRLYAIKSAEGRIYRALRFDPKLSAGKTEKPKQLLLDWQGWLALTGYAEEHTETIDLELRPVHWYELLNIGLTHPDPLYRQNTVVTIIAFWLGVVSLLATFI